MPKIALYNKYRPKTWEDVVEQQAIINILKNQLATNTTKGVYLFTGSAGTGKAQPLTSNVLTPSGYVTMGDICVGDQVVDGNGKITSVVGVYPQGIRPIYKITFSDRSSIEVSDEHLNYVFRYNQYKKCKEYFTVTTLQLIDLLKTSKYKIRVDVPTIDCWKNTDLPLHPYLLGMLIAEGSFSNNFSISLYEDDVYDKVSSLLKQLGYELKLSGTSRINKDYKIIQTEPIRANQFIPSDNYLKNTLKNMGLLCKSIDKHIPKEYLYTTKENRLLLLQGLMDGDGYIENMSNGGCCYTYNTSSKQLSDDFAFLVRSLGMVDTVVSKPGRYKKDGQYIDCNMTYCHNIKVPNELLIVSSQKHLARRKPKQNPPIRNIVSVDYVRDDYCQCIKVESDCHTYITDNLTITHNTTTARILAKAINKGMGSPIEIDAASNNGVDAVRDIIIRASQQALDSEYKVFILDECHSLSGSAWAAMLKLIEEPPKKSVFIMCTTDPQKIPTTILSRVQRFDFKRLSTDKIIDRLIYILQQEGYSEYVPGINKTYTKEAVDYIARLSEGGMRAAISYLDTCLSLCDDLTLSSVLSAIGSVNYDVLFKLVNAIIDSDSKNIINIVEDLHNDGTDLKLFTKDLLWFVLDVVKYTLFKDFSCIKIPKSFEQTINEMLASFKDSDKFFKGLLDGLNSLVSDIKYESNIKALIEMKLVMLGWSL